MEDAFNDKSTKGKAVKNCQSNNILKILNHFLVMQQTNLKNRVSWKSYLTMKIKFMSSEDNDDKRLMHSESDNIEIMIGNKT